MKLRQFTRPWVVALACTLFIQSGAVALKVKTSGASPDSGANKAVSLGDQALDKDILILENRFFFHHYGHDPIEKRLERLELLTLGTSQFGTNSERLSHLKSAIVQRDKQAAQIMADHKVEQAKAGSGKAALKGETSYPILSTLEWRILKKTYASESIDQRLDRLEGQLFGVPAQAMSYVDRIERLKKTAGVGVESFTASRFGPSSGLGSRSGSGLGSGQGSLGTAGPFTAIRKGPMPRAGSGSDFGPNFGSNFSSDYGRGQGSLFGSLTENGQPFASSPFSGSPFSGSPFGDSDFDEGSATDRLLPEMPAMENFTDIGKLREFVGRSGGGTFSGQEIQIHIGPDGTTSSVRNFGPDGTTGSTNSFGPSDNIFEQLQKPMFEFLKRLGLAPQIDNLPNLNKKPVPREELPPYSDPNSI
jgi:hypothetical protein